ncbi:MAG: hypothetical protein ACR2PO_10485 [Methyloligellaceae bacterium]
MSTSTQFMEQDGAPEFDLRVGQVQAHVWFYGLPFLAGALLLAVAWFQPWVPVADLLRDPLSVAELSQDCCGLYFGALSNLGVIIWAGAAAACLFAGLLLYSMTGWSPATMFMVYGGLLTGLLTVDDLFLLHDFVLPHFGIPQILVYAVYGAVALGYMLMFARLILEHDAVVFLAAGSLLAISVGIDQVIHNDAPIRIFIEDGAKLLGIILWTGFHVRTALTLCGQALDTQRTMAVRRSAAVEHAARMR